MMAWPLPAVAVPMVGGLGAASGVTDTLPEAALETPALLLAWTLQL